MLIELNLRVIAQRAICIFKISIDRANKNLDMSFLIQLLREFDIDEVESPYILQRECIFFIILFFSSKLLSQTKHYSRIDSVRSLYSIKII